MGNLRFSVHWILTNVFATYEPHADEPAVGNLRFSVHWILTNVFATYADILTTVSSTSPSDLASSYYSTLPYPYSFLYDAVSVICFSPGVFSARSRLTSELLRTLSRNGCF